MLQLKKQRIQTMQKEKENEIRKKQHLLELLSSNQRYEMLPDPLYRIARWQ